MKNPLTPVGIEPATCQFVAQHLNHCATAVPWHICENLKFHTVATCKFRLSFYELRHHVTWRETTNVLYRHSTSISYLAEGRSRVLRNVNNNLQNYTAVQLCWIFMHLSHVLNKTVQHNLINVWNHLDSCLAVSLLRTHIAPSFVIQSIVNTFSGTAYLSDLSKSLRGFWNQDGCAIVTSLFSTDTRVVVFVSIVQLNHTNVVSSIRQFACFQATPSFNFFISHAK